LARPGNRRGRSGRSFSRGGAADLDPDRDAAEGGLLSRAAEQTAAATHDFLERVLLVGAQGLPEKTVRQYDQARVARTIEGQEYKEELRSDRRLLVVQRTKDQTVVYTPAGLLTRGELDLTAGHFDTFHLTGLLPKRAVAVGETWKVANPIVQALCNFEGLTTQDLTCKLEEIKDDLASISFTGTASGIDLGAQAKLGISGSCRFDMKQKRLTHIEWKQKDEREQGPVSPALAFDINVQMSRTAIAEPEVLSDFKLEGVPPGTEIDPPLLQLYHQDSRDRFEFAYDREWHITADTMEHFVMRLMVRGDWLAQVTVTPWSRAKEGEHLSPEQFQQEMASNTPGWEEEQVLQSGEVPLEGGRYCYRISALGQLDGVKTMQIFYLLASPKGEQVVVTFTMRQAQAETFGNRDLALVGGFDFPSNQKK
jgi:hypothetical protein